MNQAIAFDTHRFVKRLTDCGFTERQAETLADEQVSLLNSNLATKAAVAGIEALRQEARASLESSQGSMLKECRSGSRSLRCN